MWFEFRWQHHNSNHRNPDRSADRYTHSGADFDPHSDPDCDSPVNVDSAQWIRVSGAIVTNETIVAYSVDPTDGSNLAFLGATTADNTGNFNLTISPVPTGPMRVIADGGNLTSAMDGTTIAAPGDLAALFLTATGSIANISINPLSDFVDSLTTGNLRTPGTAFATAFNGALARIDGDYGLKTNPAQITPDYTAATVGTDAGNLGLILGAMINEDQYLCPGGAGSPGQRPVIGYRRRRLRWPEFQHPISYCGGLLFGAEGLSYFQDALSGLWQFQDVTRAFAFGATGNLLTANGLANVALDGKQVYPLAPLASINTALRNAAPIPQNSFALPAQTATMNTARGFASAALLSTGQVLIAGGGGIGGIISSVELYDPVANSFAPSAATPSMNVARDNSTATLLPNGLVLIAAGFGGAGGGSYLSSTELYNPLTNTFAAPAATATMNTARSGATADPAAQWQGSDRRRSESPRRSGEHGTVQSANQQLQHGGKYSQDERGPHQHHRNTAAQWQGADCGRRRCEGQLSGQHRALRPHHQYLRRRRRDRQDECRAGIGNGDFAVQRQSLDRRGLWLDRQHRQH